MEKEREIITLQLGFASFQLIASIYFVAFLVELDLHSVEPRADGSLSAAPAYFVQFRVNVLVPWSARP